MRRFPLTLGVVLSVLLAGCVAGGPASPTAERSPVETTSEPQTESPTATATPRETPVEYVVRAGDIPDEFASVEVTFQVVFVEEDDDLGPCYDVFSGPYKPTLTPIPPPTGECRRSERVTVNLTEVSGERSLGEFTAPAWAEGHTLLVTDLDVTRENGTRVEAIKGIGGHVAIQSDETPTGSYGVSVGVFSGEGAPGYNYVVVSKQFDPGN